MRPGICLKCGKEQDRQKEWEEAQQAGMGRELKDGKMPSKKWSQVHVVESLALPSAAKNYIIY